MKKIEPQNMRQHLMSNQSRLSTAEDVAQEIEDHWDATQEFSCDDKGQGGFIAPVGFGPEKFGFQPERGEQRKFGGYCNRCWRIGHKEAQRWFKQEYMKSNPSRDPLQRHSREWSNTSEKGPGHSQRQGKGKGKRKHAGKGNHNQDRAGSPNEDGQRRLGYFDTKSQRVEFVGDVQENGDFETPRLDGAAYVSCVQKCKSVMMDSTKLPSSSKRVSDGSEEPAGTHEHFDQSTGDVLFRRWMSR